MEIYCPQLGMMIGFSYCLGAQDGLPCRNTFGCWKERVDVAAIIKAKFTDEQIRQAFNTLPKSKLFRIFESVRSVRREE